MDARADVPTLTGHPVLLPTKFEVERFAVTKNPEHGPSLAEFKIEISEKFRTHWNKRLAAVFADDFVANNYGYTEQDRSKIVEVFLTHIKTLRSRFLHSLEGDVTQAQYDEEKMRARDARRRTVSKKSSRYC